MLSRIADALYWLSRYMERADGLLRLLYVHYILSLDKDVYGRNWRPVLEIYSWINDEGIKSLENNTQAALKNLLLDTTNQNSLKVVLNRARENARGVQDHITKEVWEEVNQLYHLVNDPSLPDKLTINNAIKVIEMFTEHSVLYTGLCEITMPRGIGWNFMNLGRYIERCLQTITTTEKQLEVIDFKDDASDILQWRHLLLSLSGYELHLKTYRTSNFNYNALHQIVVNENFTRSILYSLEHLNIYLKRVNAKSDEESNQLFRSFGRLYSKVKYVDLEILDTPDVEQFLNEVKTDLLNFSKLLSEHFFSYS